MDSFDIDAFLSKTFKDMETKEKSKETSKKKSKQDKKQTPMIIEQDNNINNINNANKKITIQNIPKEKVDIFNENKIDMKIYSKINLDEIKTEKNIQTKNLIKPLFPNDEVFEKEFTPDKIYLIDKFINRTTKKNKKKQMKLNYTHNMIKNLKKENMEYNTLLSMNQLWKEYITELMNNSNNDDTILNKMLKADLHGAILKVINSTNKNNIGINGIVIFESKRTFNILNQKNEIKTILKNGSVFEVEINNGIKIIIYGDNFIFKSAERTKIKFKPKFYFNAELFKI